MTSEPDPREQAPHDLEALIARARAARVSSEVLANLVINAAVENIVARAQRRAVRLTPTVQAQLQAMLGAGAEPTRPSSDPSAR